MAHAHQWHHMAGLNFPLSLNRSWREPSTTWGALISSKPNQWMHDRTPNRAGATVSQNPAWWNINWFINILIMIPLLKNHCFLQETMMNWRFWSRSFRDHFTTDPTITLVMCDLRSWTWRSDASSLAWWRDSTYATPWTNSGCEIRPAYPMDPVRHRPSGFVWNDTRRSKTSRGLVPGGMEMNMK